MRFYLRTLCLAVFAWIMIGCGSSQSVLNPELNKTVTESDGITNQTSDSIQQNVQEVQFLKLVDSDSDKTFQQTNGSGETAAIENVKKHYANALNFWFVEQNAEAAKQEYLAAIDALVALGDILASKESYDEDAANGNGGDLMLPFNIGETRTEQDDTQVTDRSDYGNWLANGIIEHYRNLLELKNEFNGDAFNQTVLSRLAFFDTGLSGLSSYGSIKAPIAKGHALDYIPMNIENERIQKYIDYMTKDGGANIRFLYKKMGQFENLIREVIKQEGVSEDLIYLAMIESGFSATARSRAHAVGPWQFTKSTAAIYGMNVDWWVDERRDIFVSTKAAIKHLKDLFNIYGDWYLVLAAYNAGPGGVNRAMKKNNTRDYWEMSKMPREAKNYVPYFIASATIAKNPDQFGVTLEKDIPMLVDTVTVTECLDLEIIAGCVHSTVDSIRDINPALLRWCTPPTTSRYLLKLPSGTRAKFLENYAKIPQEKKRSWVRYQVRYGETLSLIANRYGTDIKAIMQANQLKSSVNLITGQYIIIPVAPKSYTASAVTTPVYTKSATSTGNYSSGAGSTTTKKKVDDKAGKKKILYKVEGGNTLGEIAEWYNILAQNIRDWNGLYYGDPIFPGQVLTLWIDTYIPDEGYRNATKKKAKEISADEPGTKIYVVQDNDTLISIAKLFNVEVSSIKRWNKLSSNSIRVGEKLKIYVGTNN
ncbi:LysM peptidoglycan-binding domain-containing protein [bacterium]|nr:LysM peptidoglycan-binding domain-containing protein [bacterium]